MARDRNREETTMAEQPPASDLRKQLHQHLDSLRAAGVYWLPAAHTAPLPEPPQLPESESDSSGEEEPQPEEARGTDRRQELSVIAGRVASCTRCPQLASTRRKTVFGVGPLDPDLCLVGEAPGFDEDRTGEPFVGKAGQLLNRIIAACGMKREEVYICNILKCRPPGNRNPLPDEAAHCREYLERQLELVKPRFLCALGAVAANNLLGLSTSIGRLRGRFLDYRGIPVMCTYHPSYLLRSPEKKKYVWEDMKKLLVRMGRPIPEPKKRDT
jgi:uracil-DNA glycosylase family 4